MDLSQLETIDDFSIDGGDNLKTFYLSNAWDFAEAIKYMSQSDRKHFEGFLENGAIITSAAHIGYGVISAYTDGGDSSGKYDGIIRSEAVSKPDTEPFLRESPFNPPHKMHKVQLSRDTTVMIYTWKTPFKDMFKKLSDKALSRK